MKKANRDLSLNPDNNPEIVSQLPESGLMPNSVFARELKDSKRFLGDQLRNSPAIQAFQATKAQWDQGLQMELPGSQQLAMQPIPVKNQPNPRKRV